MSSQETFIVDNDLAATKQDNVEGLEENFLGQRVETIVLAIYKGKDGRYLEVATRSKRQRQGSDTVLSERKRILSPQEAKERFAALGSKDSESI